MFIFDHDVKSVIEFGCGDGNQLNLAKYPAYIGVDVSPTAIKICHNRFAGDETKSFLALSEYRGETAGLALSLDVIYHLVEDDVFHKYMATLFAAAGHFVMIYSSNSDSNSGVSATHVRHRRFTDFVAANYPAWYLIQQIPNKYPYNGINEETSFSDFFIYEMRR